MRTRLAAVVALVLFAACGPPPARLRIPTATPAESGSAGPVDWGPLAVSTDYLGGNLALTSGVLRITESCVLLEAPDGRTTLPVWWKDRTTWDAAARVIRVENAGGTVISFGDGQRISLGGSGTAFRNAPQAEITPWETWLDRIAWEVEPDPACSPDEAWSVGDAALEP